MRRKNIATAPLSETESSADEETVAASEAPDAVTEAADENDAPAAPATATTTTAKGNKRRSQKIDKKKAMSPTLARNAIFESAKAVYESKSGFEDSDFKLSLGRLAKCVEKARKFEGFSDTVEEFVTEMLYRLSLTVDTSEHAHKRCRVMKLFAVWSVKMATNEANPMPKLLEAIAEFCKENASCYDALIRQNSVMLISETLSVLNTTKTLDTVDLSLLRLLYSTLRSFHVDKADNVRLEVLHAVRKLQTIAISPEFVEAVEKSPVDILKMGLYDKSPACRMFAIRTIAVEVSEQFEDLIEVALEDPHPKVRDEAFARLGACDIEMFTEMQRRELLATIAYEMRVEKRKNWRNGLVLGWLHQLVGVHPTQRTADDNSDKDGATITPVANNDDPDNRKRLGSATMELLSRIDVDPTKESMNLARDIMFVAFDAARQRTHEELSLSDLLTSMYQEEQEPVAITRKNYKSLLKKSMPVDEQFLRIFHWRCLVDYFTRDEVDQMDKFDTVPKLMPTMLKMCEFARVLIQFQDEYRADLDMMDEDDAIVIRAKMEAILGDVLSIIKHTDCDPSGAKAWKSLLETIIRRRDTSKSLMDLCMQDLCLKQLHATPEDFLSYVTDICADMVDHEINPNATMANMTVSLPTSLSQEPGSSTGSSEATYSLDLQEFCCQLLNSMLKTGVFFPCRARLGQNATLRSIHEKLEKVWLDVNNYGQETRKWATEAIGILCLLSRDLAMLSGPTIFMAAYSLEGSPKLLFIDIITDMIITYHLEVARQLFEQRNVSAPIDTDMIFSLYTKALYDVNADSQMVFKCCESACKLLLAERRSGKPWAKLLGTLMMRATHKPSMKLANLMSCLNTFFPLLCGVSRRNQNLLSEAFFEILPKSDTNDLSYEMDNTLWEKWDASKFVNIVVEYTSEYAGDKLNVRAQEDEPETTLHHSMLTQIHQFLEENVSDRFCQVYVQVASELELTGIDQEGLSKLREDYDSLLETFRLIDTPQKTVTELRKFVRRLEKASEGQEEEPTCEDEANQSSEAAGEKDDVVGDLKTVADVGKTPSKPAKKVTIARSTVKATPKTTAAVRKRTNSTIKRMQEARMTKAQDEADADLMPGNMLQLNTGATPAAPPPATRTRPVLSRTAKREKLKPAALFKD